MQVLHRLPTIELPYETLTHNEVRVKDPLYIYHPYGKRFYAWFTYDRHRPICYLLEVSNKKIIHSTVVVASFNPELCLGTLLYGTMVHKNDKRCFVIDNIIQDRGNMVKESYHDKLTRIEHILTYCIDNQILLTKQIMFMLPEMATSMESLQDIIPVYNVYCIKIIPMHGPHKVFNYIKKQMVSHMAVFRVKACTKSDLYELFVKKNDEYAHYGYGFIDTYTRSVMMNDLFRHIPENHILDKIEESDEENELEDIYHTMEFEWNSKFKKWIPLHVTTKAVMDEMTIRKLERT